MRDLDSYEAWFITGSQHLYGKEVLRKVDEHAQQIARELNSSSEIPVRIVHKPVVATSDAIHGVCQEASRDDNCVGIITWMHTFSPAKMWISGLRVLQKPLAHLHTQFNRDIPWSTIDMDFMNMNQSAHGGREFGHICTRIGLRRKVIVGHWQDAATVTDLAAWTRAAVGWRDAQGAHIARFGDNMRDVAVTEGDKVEAQIQFGYTVNGFGLGDLVAAVDGITDEATERLVQEYDDCYSVTVALSPSGERRESLRDAARIELGLRAFLEEGNFKAFTDTFENLHGLRQLPGIAVQRLMNDGYGFAAEGDWKTAALVRAMKVMAEGLKGGTSFMEDYTYHLDPINPMVLGAHMLEICPSIAANTPSVEIHPLSIGEREDPVRLIFETAPGEAVNVAIQDLGDEFRMLVNEVDVVSPPEMLPKLPVARALWKPRPDLKTATTAWILAGGPHHTSFSQALHSEHLENFAEMAGLQLLLIDNDTSVRAFKNDLNRR